jgi:Domain of unknown function (DUF397)
MNQHSAEPSQEELDNAQWVKARASTGSNGCVEVVHLQDWTAVRDSKHPGGPVQLYTPHEWACFIDGVSKGEFDRA